MADNTCRLHLDAFARWKMGLGAKGAPGPEAVRGPYLMECQYLMQKRMSGE